MKKPSLLPVICLLVLNQASAAHTRDSGFRKHGIHVMISANRLILAANKNNPANFFYSAILIEPQYNSRRHTFGVGIYRSRNSTTYKVNELPCTENRQSLSMMPTYSYLPVFSRHWQIYTGLSLIYNYADTITTTESDVEVITRRSSVMEKGFSVFARVFYRFNRHVSLGLELPINLTMSVQRIEWQYPLTPSMSFREKSSPVHQGMYFIPSQIFLRLSL
jgi:hypothetical protein